MNRKKIISIASGYFNPIHKGHIELLEKAKTFSDQLIVIVNNDHQRALKGSKEFQDENERCKIVSSLKVVDGVFLSIDEDRTVIESIKHLYKEFGNPVTTQIFFVNGGDQFSSNIPERKVCDELGIYTIDGLGDKIQSSSYLLTGVYC
jgi:cytidyltransferase-like protein